MTRGLWERPVRDGNRCGAVCGGSQLLREALFKEKENETCYYRD